MSSAKTEDPSVTDKCVADMLMKGGSGMLIGAVITLCFSRPRTFPIWLGLGFGIGLAYDCCQSRWKAINSDSNAQ